VSEGQERSVEQRATKPQRIGPWRLLEIVQATMPFRGGGLWATGMIVPEYGPADVSHGSPEPEEELPGSNISEHERNQAVERERARRFVRTRRPGQD
jgi:hypothetical protein